MFGRIVFAQDGMVYLAFALVGVALGIGSAELPISMPVKLGMIMLAGIVVNNAIVLVEYIEIMRERGSAIRSAVLEAARLRLRPILMTAISSIAGFMPLVVAAGAGAASRQAIGTGVVGGMVAATFMSLIFTPVFFVVMQRLSGFRKTTPEKEQTAQKEIAAPPSPKKAE